MTQERLLEIQQKLVEIKQCTNSLILNELAISEINTVLEMFSDLQIIAEELIGEIQ